jgi:hypothetical protein
MTWPNAIFSWLFSLSFQSIFELKFWLAGPWTTYLVDLWTIFQQTCRFVSSKIYNCLRILAYYSSSWFIKKLNRGFIVSFEGVSANVSLTLNGNDSTSCWRLTPRLPGHFFGDKDSIFGSGSTSTKWLELRKCEPNVPLRVNASNSFHHQRQNIE